MAKERKHNRLGNKFCESGTGRHGDENDRCSSLNILFHKGFIKRITAERKNKYNVIRSDEGNIAFHLRSIIHKVAVDAGTIQTKSHLLCRHARVIVAKSDNAIGPVDDLNDRLKLRSMVTAEHGERVYIASEEAAIRAMDPDAGNFYAPSGGEPVIVKVKEGVEL